jgi:predicted DNA-binding transcriptional regulator AlpA
LNSSPRITPRFVRTHDAAAFLGLSGRTLEKHRCTGTGPVFRKLGGRVVYAIEDLEAWAAARARNSTSDPDPKLSSGGAVLPRSELPRPR